MSGVTHGPARLISQGAAERLFEELIYDRVLELVDLDRLHQLQCFLGYELYRLGFESAEIATLAGAMIDRALQRLAADGKRYEHVGIGIYDCDRVAREIAEAHGEDS